MTSLASIVPLHFWYSTHTLCNTMLLAMETAVHVAFIIAEPHLTFNWPLKHTGEMELHRGVEWTLNPCYPNMLTCKLHPTPVHFAKEATLWGSSQWLTLQPLSSGTSSICMHCWIVCFGLPLALSLPMLNDWPIACFELWMRVLLRQPWKEID